MAKLKGLGRGLDALLAADEETAPDRLVELPTAALRPGRYQPRTQIDSEAIGDLAESIKTQGMIQPIVARPLPDGQYEIIAGERRWHAAKLAGLASVPALVRDIGDDQALIMALIENIQREDLNALEEAQGIQRLITEFGMTHDAAAAAVGRSRSGVTNLLRLLALAKPVQDLVLRGAIEMGHGRALLPLPAAEQIETAHQIIARALSVRETEALVRRFLTPREAAQKRPRDRDVVALEEELSDRLGLRVKIVTRGKGGGEICMAYSSLDQLDGLLARLR